MNSRCDTDPLDVAEDVCDLCGGEFCEACLLWPRGRRKPAVCKSCAIRSSGIRGTTRPGRVMSRREANQRREIIRQTRDSRKEAGFVFFDQTDDYVAFGEEGAIGAGAEREPEPTRRRISFGRKKHQEEVDEAEARTTAGDSPESDGEGPTVETSLHDDPLEPTPDDHDIPSATEMLARIRSQMATSESPAAHQQPLPPSVHSGGPLPGTLGTIPTSGPGFDPSIDPFSLQLDPFDTSSALYDPAPPPPPPPPPRNVNPPEPTPVATGQRPLEAPTTPSADVDAEGNWIPPLLRGMAPLEERERDSLPRRPPRS